MNPDNIRVDSIRDNRNMADVNSRRTPATTGMPTTI
jgi:hypothetical protein